MDENRNTYLFGLVTLIIIFRFSLYQSLATFMAYFVIYFIAYILRSTPFSALNRYSDLTNDQTSVNVSLVDQIISDSCYLAYYETTTDKVGL